MMAVGNQRRIECIIGGLAPDRVGMALKLRGDAIAQVSAELRPGRRCVDDRHDVLDRQLRAGERVPPSAVKLDVPKCRADPIVIRAPLRGAIARADRRDDPVPDLDLDPARRLEVSRNNHHSLFTRSGRANGSHSRHAVATVVSGWAHARLVSLRCSAAPTKSRKSGWALVGLD
ncbi:MAG: hypothetical protein ACLQU5_24435 [Isosphaeraceae bacterium]